jgi:N-acyl-D-aspartate/D-glutamate deacylase
MERARMNDRLVVRGGTVVDGTGMPAFTADVEVTNGRITRVGRFDAGDARVVEADGLVVAPGFIDLHTHYDAQLHFEPTASPSSWHGVTTVVVGNCGFSLAPSKPDDVAWTAKMLSRVEGMSEDALLAGVTYAGGPMSAFFDNLEGTISVNMAAYAGHCAIRRWVMGEAASERVATPDEIAQMVTVLEQALDDGAVGLSTSQLDIHVDHEGRPVPCNFATRTEIETLAATLSTRSSGAISFFPRSFIPGLDADDAALVEAMSRLSGKPVHGNVLGYFHSAPEGWRRNLHIAETLAAKGLRYYPMLVLNPKGVHFAFDSTFIFDEYPTWRPTLTLPFAERMAALSSPSVRDTLRRELDDRTLGSLAFAWDEIQVVWTASDALRANQGRDVASIAREKGIDPLDAMLDLAVADGLRTNFAIRRKTSADERAVIDQLVDHPLLMPGSSDGGAHLLTFCGADYTTRLIAEHVPERLTIEQAVNKLSFAPAVSLGLLDRGLLRPGMAGDLVVFDPSRIAVGAVEMRHDFPTGAARLVFGAEGYHATIVNGRPIVLDGETTGEIPGHVIRMHR